MKMVNNTVVIVVVFVFCFLSVTSSNPISKNVIPSWEEFKQTYGKAYDSPAEEVRRQEIFHQNVEFIKRFKSEEHTFSVGMNEFGDLTAEEFGAKFRKFNHNNRRSVNNHQQVVSSSSLPSLVGDVPAEKDWRQTGCLAPVRNQGQCGSAYTYAFIELLQDMVCIEHQRSVLLSFQELADCASGCQGGLIDDLFNFCLHNGVESASSYQPSPSGLCNAGHGTVAVKCTEIHNIPQGNETAILQVLGNYGPVLVAIEADDSAFQFYESGVFVGPCGKQLDHAMLAIGYGGTGSLSYYIMQNSWGTSWGEGGYIMMQRGQDLCGLADAAAWISIL